MLGKPPQPRGRRTPLTDEQLLRMSGRSQRALTFDERVRRERLRNGRKAKA